MTSSRAGFVGLIAVSLLALSSCGIFPGQSDPAEKPSLEELAQQALSSLSGVSFVNVTQAPVDGTPEDSDERSDPDLWSLNIDVVMSDDVTPDQAAAAAEATRAFANNHVGSAPWVARLRIGDIEQSPQEDRSNLSRVQIDVYPTVRTSAGTDALDAMQLKNLSRVTSVAITNAAVLVQVADAQDLDPVVDQLRSLPIWKDGGNVHVDNGRVRLADVPTRITTRQLQSFFAASVTYPEAEFAIESSDQSPEVYVNGVTVQQAREISTSFTRPRLAHTNEDDFELEFNIRASDATETLDSHGTFGQPENR